MRVILFGATGMIGQGVLRECLRDDQVTAVLVVGRAATGHEHPKLRELVRADVSDLEPVAGELDGYDACLFCLGVSAAGMKEHEYRRITHDLTLAVARALLTRNPQLRFGYVSGAGTDSAQRSRMMWARVKGRTENALRELMPATAYMFRPGFIQPRHGVRSKTGLYRAVYAVTAPLLPVLGRLFPNAVTDTERLGRAMITVARDGAPQPVLQTRDINALAASR